MLTFWDEAALRSRSQIMKAAPASPKKISCLSGSPLNVSGVSSTVWDSWLPSSCSTSSLPNWKTMNYKSEIIKNYLIDKILKVHLNTRQAIVISFEHVKKQAFQNLGQPGYQWFGSAYVIMRILILYPLWTPFGSVSFCRNLIQRNNSNFDLTTCIGLYRTAN